LSSKEAKLKLTIRHRSYIQSQH